jgi:hypothetical protein
MPRTGLMATETTESTDPRSPTPEAVLPPRIRCGGEGKKSLVGWVGVRGFRGFRGSSGVGLKGLELSLQSLTPKFP